MTDKEIKELATAYAESAIIGLEPHDIEEQRRIEYDFALPVLEWLSDRFCIVEKSKAKESYREHKESYDRLCKSQWDETPYQCEEQGAMDELESLFGKELFTNTEQ